MGGDCVAEGKTILREIGIPDFAYPDTACRAFEYMWRYSQNLTALYETPSPANIAEEGLSHLENSRALIEKVQKDGRTLLTEKESKDLLAAYGIPVVPTEVARTEEDAKKIAQPIGFPIVLKLYSETITHKTDVGGVKLNLKDEKAVAQAFQEIKAGVPAKDFSGVTVQPMVSFKDGYELIVGSTRGPAVRADAPLRAGRAAGGSLQGPGAGPAAARTPRSRGASWNTRKFTRRSRASAAARPSTSKRSSSFWSGSAIWWWTTRASRRSTSIRSWPLPKGSWRWTGASSCMTRASRMKRCRVPPSALTRSSTWARSTLKNGKPVTIRPILHQDEPLMIKFHETLSEQSVYLRYFQALKLSQRVTHERLMRRCFIDYDREMALVAEGKNDAGEREIFGVARLIKLHGRPDAEFAVVISDASQKQGLGAELMKRILQVARDEKVQRVVADLLQENAGMQHLCEKFGFKTHEPAVRRLHRQGANSPCRRRLRLPFDSHADGIATILPS